MTTLLLSPAEFRARVGAAETHLAEADPVMAAVIARYGPCTFVPHWDRSPFEALVRAVAHQQLQGKAAEAILGRFIALFAPQPFPSPAEIEAIEETAIRRVGFSASKTAAIRAIAAAALAGTVPGRDEAEAMDDAELIGRLVSIRGVGRWTAEMLLIFTLGRLDVFPLDDFGVKTGLRVAYGLEGLPAKRQMIELSERWQPVRSVASWYLWRIAQAAPRLPRKGPPVDR